MSARSNYTPTSTLYLRWRDFLDDGWQTAIGEIKGKFLDMNASLPPHWANWLDQQIWPQIYSLMSDDAYFKLMGRARELTGEFNGPIAGLIQVGYVTCQTIAIRRLCDPRRDVISLRRLLVEAGLNGAFSKSLVAELSGKLDRCDHICGLVNDYIAHTANPVRRPQMSDWNLKVGHLTEAQQAICDIAVKFDRDLLQRKNNVKIIPVPQFDIMQELKPWVPEDVLKELWEFWHAHNNAVNAWVNV